MKQPNWTPENSSWGGDPKRGAAMGRRGSHGTPETLKFTLRRIPINSGGYDSGGAYWGLGAPLYWYCSDDGEAEGYFRVDKADGPDRNEEALALYWGTPEDSFKSDHDRLRREFPEHWAYYEAKNKERHLARCHVRKLFPGARFYG